MGKPKIKKYLVRIVKWMQNIWRQKNCQFTASIKRSDYKIILYLKYGYQLLFFLQSLQCHQSVRLLSENKENNTTIERSCSINSLSFVCLCGIAWNCIVSFITQQLEIIWFTWFSDPTAYCLWSSFYISAYYYCSRFQSVILIWFRDTSSGHRISEIENSSFQLLGCGNCSHVWRIK